MSKQVSVELWLVGPCVLPRIMAAVCAELGFGHTEYIFPVCAGFFLFRASALSS